MSRGRNHLAFTSVRTEGGLLPSELLTRITAGDKDLPGLKPADYHLGKGERIGEAVNRSWSRLLGAWKAFKDELDKLPATDLATGLTRDRWLLPLFSELGYGRLPRSTTTELDGRSFPISHFWNHSPIHLLGCRIQLDRRARGVAGAAQASPHGLVQDFLNRSDDHLWGFVSNGFQLRVLRDHHSLTQQAFVEFDLQAIMEGEQYSDFLLLWMVCHQSRVEGTRPAECLLEQWFVQSAEEGVRALDALREGVEKAIEHLGAGFLRHPANDALRQALRSGELSAQDYYRELLRLIYRFIFLLVTEDRGLLLVGEDEAAKRRYLEHYSMRRLRELADRARPGRHGDLWHGTRVAMSCLELGCEGLALPALGSLLWRADTCRRLTDCELGNRDLLMAMQQLCFIRRDHRRLQVSWRNMGAEELGSIYEALLELHPTMNLDALAAGAGVGAAFSFDTAAGHERKTTGSYYTPTSLVDCLLETALDPVIERAAAQPDPEAALLALKACDPACGSGHFLIATARRIAERLAAVRSGDDEPSPEAMREALRDVISHCIYGVDMNLMAVELCKISLWLEALDPGKPLSFLDHHIRCGNSLLGATPALIERGLPDDAFKPIEGDDRRVCLELKQQNQREQAGGGDLFPAMVADVQADYRVLHSAADQLGQIDEDSVEGVREKEAAWAALTGSDAYRHAHTIADAWCAAFVWPKVRGAAPCPTTETIKGLAEGSTNLTPGQQRGLRDLVTQYQFFHWHLEFPEVFKPTAPPYGEHEVAGWQGGFDAVLGNPPWERLKLQEQEWFAVRDPEIAGAPNAAARQRRIATLRTSDPSLHAAFLEARRAAEGASHIVRSSGAYPLCGRGDVNTYPVFVELNRRLIGGNGRVGCIVPSGIATDDTTKYFFQAISDNHELASLYDFENRRAIFQGVHRSYKFCLLTLSGSEAPVSEGAEYAFFLHAADDLADPDRRFRLTAEDIKLINPNTRTCPIFRTQRDAKITKAIYRRVPILIREGVPDGNPWGIRFSTMFHMSNDSGLFRTRDELEADGWHLKGNIFVHGAEKMLPLYEAKMIHHFNHRFGDLSGPHSERWKYPDYEPMPRYWVPENEVRDRLSFGRRFGEDIWHWDREWLLGWRNICRSTDARTFIASFMPIVGVGHSMPLMFVRSNDQREVLCLLANFTSLVMDYVARLKIGGTNFTYGYLNQVPVLPSSIYQEGCAWNGGNSLLEWITPRVLELVVTSTRLMPLASKCCQLEVPFAWLPDRRIGLRCELDAAFFHLYGLGRSDVEYICETFPIVRKNDIEEFGDYRTKLMILKIYDAMRKAIDTGNPYKTILDPEPGSPQGAAANDPGVAGQ